MFSFQGTSPEEVGVDWSEGPPVPIPNTEVKPLNAENSECEDRKLPSFFCGKKILQKGRKR